MSDLGSDEDAQFRNQASQAATPGSEDDAPGYLGGLPEGFTASRPVSPVDTSRAGIAETGGLNRYGRPSSGVAHVPPAFRDGYQYSIYSMTPEQIANLQRSLVRAGLLDLNDIEGIGVVGPGSSDATFAAYEQLLGFANQAGYRTTAEALAALQQGGYGQGPGGTLGKPDTSGGGGGGLPSQISNADDLRRTFRAAVIDTLGEGWSESQIDSMVNAYQALERGQVAQAEQMALDTAARAASSGQFESPGTIESLPDPTTFAENEARKADPTGAQAHDFLGTANQFYSLLGAWTPGQ